MHHTSISYTTNLPAAGLSSAQLNRSISQRDGSPSPTKQVIESPDKSNKSRGHGTSSPSPNRRYDFLSGGVTSGGNWADWRKDTSASKQQQYQTITTENLRASKLDGSPSPTRNKGASSALSGYDATSVSPSRATSRTKQNNVLLEARAPFSQTAQPAFGGFSPDPRRETMLRENAMWSISG